MAGTNQAHIWKIETGQDNVNIRTLCHLADALDVKVSDLIDF